MANLGLVADYSSSSGNESDIEENEYLKKKVTNVCVIQPRSVNYFESIPDEEEPSKCLKIKERKKKILANPLRNDSSTKSFVEPSSSVFYNPFKKEQEAKKSVLEKHVKLTTNPKDVLEINGKKICWNYRKGRCKFGHKCKYAHDSDLIGGGALQNKNNLNSVSSDTYDFPDDVIIESETEEVRKRKPGLAEGLVPNKRSRKMYKDSQSKDTPWMKKR